LCTLSQLQRRNHDEAARADASAQECLDLLRNRPKAELTLQLSGLVDNALDLGDLSAAARWFKQIPAPPGNGADDALPSLVRARYVMLSGRDDEAVAIISGVQPHLPNNAGSRELLWRSQALQADLACRSQQFDAGAALRQQVLQAAAAAEPERVYQQKRLTRLSVACEVMP
jgi:hypothetical protein